MHHVNGPLLESVAIPDVKALCECTFTVSVSYFYDSNDYFGPSSQIGESNVLGSVLALYQGPSRGCAVQLLMKRLSYHKTSSCRCFMTSFTRRR